MWQEMWVSVGDWRPRKGNPPRGPSDDGAWGRGDVGGGEIVPPKTQGRWWGRWYPLRFEGGGAL